MKRRSLASVLALLVAVFALAGCRPSPGESSDRVFEVTQRLADGRSVVCLVYTGYQAGGLSCDWPGHR